jgi:TonB family protein
VKQWTFKPATLNGAPVATTVSVELAFARQSAPTVYRIEDGVTAPVATRRVNPMYPPDVAREGVIGTVLLEGVVRPDGTIIGILVKRSADTRLDAEAIRALSEWQFKPGELAGRPVAVIVQIEMTFTLK